MIIIFSSNENGGLIQMAIKVSEEILNLGKEIRCFLPTVAKGNFSKEMKPYIIRYKKAKTTFPYNSCARLVASQMQELKPDLIWYVDNGTFSSQVAIQLANRIKQVITMHDAGTSHSSFDRSIKHRIKHLIEKKTSESCNKRIDWIMTCSPNSKRVYSKLYPSQKDKVYMLPLGPHMPECEDVCPGELESNLTNYLLFFGRIDKYKGIDILLKTFSEWKGKRKLVIAGGGQLLQNELEVIKKDSRIILINRFIKDEEMNYLFHNARALVLPYKDATQSGILPIAYMCSKPVICSDVIGISQFVENYVTGIICSDDESYIKAYSDLEDIKRIEDMSNNARRYYEGHLDWKKNIRQLLKDIDVQ